MGKLQSNDVLTMFTELWNTDGLIFDIRNYPNGTLWDLINYLFTQSLPIANFTNPDESYPGTISWDQEILSVVTTSLGTYNKQITIIFNEQTQSHAEYTVMGLEKYPGAIKLGSQTAGADGNVSYFYLPGHIIAYFTGLGTYYPDGTATQRIGIVPDIEVRQTITGIRSGRDELLEAALETLDINTDNKPAEFILQQNYPNPFNPETSINFSLKIKAQVQLKIYNSIGELVKTAIHQELSPGVHHYKFNAHGINSGVYFYRLNINGRSQVKKMVMIK